MCKTENAWQTLTITLLWLRIEAICITTRCGIVYVNLSLKGQRCVVVALSGYYLARKKALPKLEWEWTTGGIFQALRACRGGANWAPREVCTSHFGKWLAMPISYRYNISCTYLQSFTRWACILCTKGKMEVAKKRWDLPADVEVKM